MIQKIKKILVPIDFSSCSENALIYATKLATKINAVIHVLHVATVEVGKTENPSTVKLIIEEKINSTRHSLQYAISEVINKISQSVEVNPKVKTVIEFGSAPLMISEIAKRNQIDCIVMGTQGENSVSDRLLGTTTSSVIKSALCPLFIIPERAAFQSSIIMGYASNLINADPFEIWKATHLIKPIKPIAIHSVHFSNQQENFDKKLIEFKAFFSEKMPDLEVNLHNVRFNNKVKSLNDFIIQHDINLMVMYRPTRSFWEALFNESFTQEMSKFTHVPLLILKEKNK